MANNIKGITIEIGGNTGPLNTALKDINKTSGNLQSELKEVNKQLKFDPNSTVLLTQKQNLLKQSTEALKEKQAILKEAVSQAQAQFEKGDLGADKVRAVEREYQKVTSQLKDTEEQAKKTSSTFGLLGEKSEKMNTTMKNVGVAVGAASVALGTVAVKSAMDFQDGLAKISTIADTTQMSMKDIGDGVIALSDKTGKSTDDLNESLYQAISSGVQTGDTLTFMDTAAKAAVGGFTDTETAVDGLTTVLNAYGLKATEANGIANQMMVAQNLGKTTFGELATTIGNAIPTFATANVSTKEFFSSMGVLTANGIKTSEAVTGLKASLSNIIKPTDEALKAADSLGLKFNAAELATKGWMPFLQEVKTKLKDVAPEYEASSEKVATLTAKIAEMTKSGKTTGLKELKSELKGAKADMASLSKASSGQLSAFATMFGSVEGLNTVLTLTSDQGVKLYNESMKQMSGNTDYVSDAFNKIKGTTGSTFKDTINEAKNLATELGEQLKPAVDEILNLVKWLLANKDSVLGTLIAIAAGLAAFNVVVMIQGVISAFNKWKVAVEGMTIAQKAWNLATAGNPIGMIVALIAVAVAAIIYLWNTNEGFRNAILNIWNSIKSAVGAIGKWFSTDFVNFFKGAWSNIQGAFSAAPGFFSGLGSKISGALNTAGSFIKGNWKSIALGIVNPIAGATTLLYKYNPGFKAWADNMMKTVKAGITSGLEAIKNFFSPFVEGLKNTLLSIWTPIQNGLMTAWNGIKIAASGAWELIKNVVLGPVLLLIDLVTGDFGKLKTDMDKIWLNIQNAIKTVWNGILTFYTGIWQAISGGFVAFWTAIINGVVTACNQAKAGIMTAWNAVSQFFVQTWANIKAGIINAWNGFLTTITATCTNIKTGIINIWNSVIAWFQALPGTLMTIGANMFTSMQSGVNSTVNNVTSAVKTGIGAAIDWIKALPAEALQWGKDIIDGIVDGIKSAADAVGDAVKGVAQNIRKFLHFSKPDEGPLADFDTYMPDMMDSIVQGITKNVSKVSNAAKQVAAAMAAAIPTTWDTGVQVNTAMSAAYGNTDASSGSTGNGKAGTQTQTAAGAVFKQTVNNYSPKALTPSEAARQTRNATRQLLLTVR